MPHSPSGVVAVALTTDETPDEELDTGVRALVTGGAGFIGSHVVDALLRAKCEVTVVDDLSNGRAENLRPAVAFTRLDIAEATTPSVIAAVSPDVVVHCAAQASVPRSFQDPVRDARSNVLGTLHVLAGAVAGGCRRLVYVTTGGAIYGRPIRLPCDEDHPVDPLSPYGLSKWTAEEYVRLLTPREIVAVTLRLANVYGPGQRGDGEGGVVATFLARMSAGCQVEIHGDGEQTRDFVFVVDVARAVMSAIEARESTTVNIGTGAGVSVNELFTRLASFTGYDQAAEHVAERPGDIRHSRLDSRRARTVLGWQPTTDLAEGLRATVEAAGLMPLFSELD